MRIRVHAEAESELQSVTMYYEDCQVGLGRDFHQRVMVCMEAISRNPLQFARYEALPSNRDFRRMMVERFPYLVVYQVLAEEILVVAVAHSSRRPGYWKGRQVQND